MNPAAVTAESALKLRPSVALDVFVFEYVLGGMLPSPEVGAASPGTQIPSFSRRWADSHLLLIKLMVENREDKLEVQLGDQFYDLASAAGHVASEKPVPVWKLSLLSGKHVAYGRKFEEALCKLSIVAETKRRQEMIL